MCFHLATGDGYDVSKLIPIRNVPWYQRMILRLLTPFYIPKVLFEILSRKIDRNYLHDGKRNLSGKKLTVQSQDYLLTDIKKTSKVFKVTINDLITGCLASALKQYFEMKGDKDTKRINICIPANIRYKHYEDLSELKLENKFAPAALDIPLFSDVK